ncbi:hypothetical protein ACFWFZ_27455 [Streptomyces sp. NPDC060232]|uniref:hypothetical protein n=1 Tax=Streptomyces sp. NPDC060232 TaxID=3347079 RepID=UPI00364D2BC8
MTSGGHGAGRLYEITYLGAGPEQAARTVEAGEVAAVIAYADEHGMQVLVRPHHPPAPSTRDGSTP